MTILYIIYMYMHGNVMIIIRSILIKVKNNAGMSSSNHALQTVVEVVITIVFFKKTL